MMSLCIIFILFNLFICTLPFDLRHQSLRYFYDPSINSINSINSVKLSPQLHFSKSSTSLRAFNIDNFFSGKRNDVDSSHLQVARNVMIETPAANSRRITANVLIDGTVEDIWQVLTDYNNLSSVVPNLIRSKLLEHPENKIRLFQEGAQNIIGFDFRASVTMDMEEDIMDTLNDMPERQLKFKLVDSFMFSAFEGSWQLRCHKRTKKFNPQTKETGYLYSTMLTYSVLVRPKGPVPVMALEWRIKEDIPPNLLAIKKVAERNATMRRQMNRITNRLDNSSTATTSNWNQDETLGLYIRNNRRTSA